MGDNRWEWNDCMDRLLAADLTATELRLALGLARLLLGWERRSHQLGETLLRTTTGLHGLSIAKARAGLIEKGLIHYVPGSPGRGHGARYELLLGDEETPGGGRAFGDDETPGVERAFAADSKPPAESGRSRRETPGVGRGLSSKDKNKTADEAKTIQARAIDAYRAAGGSLELDSWRLALVRNVKTLAGRGFDVDEILGAARQLGRERTFPGYLLQAADALREAGGPCAWEGLRRSALTAAQLADCGCPRCDEYARALEGAPA
jgi:hypothetical protein